LEYPPFKGGIATYLGNLVRLLPKGSVRVLAQKAGDTHAFDVVQDAPIYRRRLQRTGPIPSLLNVLFWMFWLIRRERPSHIVVSHIWPVGLVAWMVWRWFGIPYVVILHGMDVAQVLETGGRRASLVRRVLANASMVVANSAYTARLAESAGASAAKLKVAHPSPGFTAADVALYRSASASKFAWEMRDNHALGIGFMVLSAARLVERKGMDTLIRAVAILKKRGRRISLAIAGDGPDRKRLDDLALTEGVEEQVRFLGAVGQSELQALLAACEVFVLAPRSIGPDVEGFGIVYLEAGLLGRPVVGSRTGGVPEAVLDGRTGLLVTPDDPTALADAIQKLMDDPELASRLGFEGRKRAEHEFDPALQFKSLTDLLLQG
jgi:phosphatidylinositol alpha-1,6-mannosyltransferase